MTANLLIQSGQKSKTLRVRELEIFDDCIICGEIRRTDKKTRVILRRTYEEVSIVECGCSISCSHQGLVHEDELISLCRAAGISIGE